MAALQTYERIERECNGPATRAEVSSGKGFALDELACHDTARELLVQALREYEKANAGPRVADMLNNLGVSHRRCGNYREAIDFCKEALRLRSAYSEDSLYSLVELAASSVVEANRHAAAEYIDIAVSILARTPEHPERLAVLLLADELGVRKEGEANWQLIPPKTPVETQIIWLRRGLEAAEGIGHRYAVRSFKAALYQLTSELLQAGLQRAAGSMEAGVN